MKNRKFFFVGLLLALISCGNSEVAEKNAQSIKKIRLGMMINDVKRIMGEPEMIEIYPYNPKEYVFRYLSPSGYEDQFHVYISRSDSTVIRIDDGF